jgi:predicted ribosome quality control (RQC) complex YloA/Tae2 family protein
MDGLAIAASLVEIRRTAEGGLVRTVHEPRPGFFLFGVYGAGNCTLLVCPRDAAIRCTSLSFRNPERPSSFVMQVRKHVRGARIRAIRQSGWERTVFMDVVHSEGGERHEATLVAELTGLRGNLLLIEGGIVIGSLRRDPRNPIGQSYTPVTAQEKEDPRSVSVETLAGILSLDGTARALAVNLHGVGRQTAEDLFTLASASRSDAPWPARVADALRTVLAHVEDPKPHFDADLGKATFYPLPDQTVSTVSFGEALDRSAREQVADDAVGEDRTVRDRILQAIARGTRTARSLRQWLDAAENAAELRHRADFLMLHAVDLGRGTTAVAGEDLVRDEWLSFPVSPRMNAIENAQNLYKKARKLDRGRPTVAARLRRIEADLVRLQAALQDLESGRGVDAATEELVARRSSQKAPPAASSPREFDVDGYTILVGRSAAQNDELTRRARPSDLWLHARDASGSHVIVCRKDQSETPAHVVLEAARLAARYSKADRRGKVAVVCTEARHVRKPRGGAPGLAIVTNESTLTVELEETQ